MLISNYELLERLAETPHATVFKAYNKRNPDKLLTLKVLKENGLSEYKLTRFRQKVEHLRVLDDPRLITPLSFSDLDGTCFLTQEYFGGITLSSLMEARSPLSLSDFLTVACALTSTLEKVHEAGIIHGGIKPNNILVDGTLAVRLIDFVSAVDVRDVSHFIYDRSFVRGTLAYTSPEQTGRISHQVTVASDLYSLGVVFYEMLTGRLPFISDDPLELIHSHLAREAVAAHEVNPEVPVVVSRIVARLMQKEPEKRYRSCSGLLADLTQCRDEFAAIRTVREFPLERYVQTHRATFVSKMVGRDREAGTILGEYEEVARGEFRALFISGLSGIGKTRLIQELQKPIVRHAGYFTSGKFDVYQRNIPYSSLIQAIRNLLRTFLTESNERVLLWRERITEAVGQNGKVLTDVIPELEILIGPQPGVRPLPPVESLNRFHDVFGRFLGCLASEENPLTLFIDDLQWCDGASFDFLENIFASSGDHPYLFLIGAYRHNEVDQSHPLSRLIRNAKENGRPLKEIRLEPLKPEHCHEMVSYILDSPLVQTEALSEFIFALTEGNPLFVSESLSYLHNEDLLYLDDDRQWRWDLERIQRSRMPTTIVALFASKIQNLPRDLITLLEYCACMGNTFSPAEVSQIRGMTLLETFEVLKPALGQGLLVESKNQLQFIHDKVQEAALSAIPAERRRQIHWQVGNHLLRAVPEEALMGMEKLENLFTIASHLNLGLEEEPDPKKAYFLSDINYHAGNKALDSLATQAANDYFNRSRELLPDDCWEESHYERTFRIFQRAAKTELMCGNYGDSERLLNHLLDHAGTDLDRAECLAEQTTSLSSIGNFNKAIETANRGLAYFGRSIPDDPDEAERRREAVMGEIASMEVDVWDAIRKMPFTTDRKSKIELAYYSELIPDLYMSGLVPQLYLSAAQSTRHCLSGGMDESVIYSFSIMGLMLGEQEDFASAFRYEDLARDLSAKYPNTFGATRGMNGIVWCNMHSRSHPQEIVDYCLKAIQSGKNCGDLYNAGLSYGPLMWNLQVQGADFSVIEEYAIECLQFSNRYHLSFSVGLAEAMQAGWIEPMKKGSQPAPMDQKLAQWEQENHIASAGSYFVHRALAHYYLGEHEEAGRYLAGVRKYLSGLTDNVLKREWYVFRVLNALKLHEMGLGFEREEDLLAEIRPIIANLETWASLGPLLRPYLAFVHAELARVTGDYREARSLYLDAIDAAHRENYTFLAGHLNECLGELLGQAGGGSGRAFITEAGRLYRKCRAERKAVNLVERYPEYFEDGVASYPHLDPDHSARTLPDLDVEYLMKSSLAISAEIEQKALLEKIMNVVIESSGAEAGYLLMEENGNLFIRAESHVTDREAVKTANKRLEESSGICKAIVRYVHRTGETLILRNAGKEGPFIDNPEIQEMHLRSVLCLPVIKQSKMIGVLYLENRLSEGVFTPGKTDMVELLVSQAAISLENATLFAERRRAEEAFRETSDYLESLIDHANAPIVVWDTSRRITRFNHAFERLTGYAARDVLGRPLELLFPEEGKQRSLAHINRTSSGEYWNAVEIPIRRKSGSVRTVLWNSANIHDEDGITVIATIAQGQDITDRKLAEGELKKYAEDLKRSNQDLEWFAYISSHDLQEPLRAISGFAELLERRYKGQIDERADKYIHFIVDGTRQMQQIIQDLLSYSRVQTRAHEFDLIDTNRSLDQALLNLHASIRDTHAVITKDPLPEILADNIQITQVFQNLIGNALKFHKPETVPEIHISASRDGDAWVFSVTDNGIGIDPAHIDRIFRLFQRLHAKGEYDGTGIGLTICKRIVERHGGEITVRSEPGAGSTFSFSIPSHSEVTP
ncbi:AAA family ATPase [Methanoculleus oceani]|uniref:histidine kinase n=1 Tax=Methanoculleus oceani TaxID=2184756 RepID=A0ABD4TH97_9EURY|nr:AAA family ATPase [Methanoculleus sp. CWC-02]MCM2466854.1 phytochrome sensor protein [Methanoculleus sp. CWC-02]